MCGITGVITQKNKLKQKEVNVFKALLLVNQERGSHSTGLYNGHNIIKDILPASQFIYTVKNADYKRSHMLIGHTRFATTGTITQNNAHPFQYGNIVGVHNGIIWNYQELNSKVNVDSEVIFDQLNKNKNDYKKAIPNIEGQMALCWTADNTSFHLMRHDNPLSMALINGTLYFSSEYDPLYSILIAAYGKIDYIESLTQDTVYTITHDLKITEDIIVFPKKEKKYHIYDYDTFYNEDDWEFIDGAWQKKDKKSSYKKSNIYQLDQYEDWAYGDFYQLMNEGGCCICGHYSQMGYIDYEDYVVYCDQCKHNISNNHGLNVYAINCEPLPIEESDEFLSDLENEKIKLIDKYTLDK